MQMALRMFLTGKQQYEKLPEYLAAADICLLPAYKNEIMQDIVPIKTYEYMAMNNPVISTQLSGMMKEFGEGNGVIFVEKPNDVLDKAVDLIENKLIKDEGRKAKAFVQRFHWDDLVVEFEDNIDLDDIKQEIKGLCSIKGLPTSPLKPIIFRSENDRPQPLLDLNAGQPVRAKGMSVTIGRLKKWKKHVRFFLLVHNTIRGAAGNSILNAEFALQKGYL